jgi:hypothetical protein
MHDIMCGRPEIKYGLPTLEDEGQIRQQVSSYMADEAAIPDVTSVAQVRAVYKEMRSMIMSGAGTEQMVISPRADLAPSTPPRQSSPRAGEGLETSQGELNPLFESGKVKVSDKYKAAHQSPQGPSPVSARSPSGALDMNSYTPPSKKGAPSSTPTMEGRASPPPVIQPFITPKKIQQKGELDRFVAGPGSVQNKALENAKRRVKEKKGYVKEVTNEINFQKDRIDFLMAQLQSGATSPSGGGGGDGGSPTSPRAEDPTKQLKLAKKTYRLKMEELKEAKNEVKFETHQKEQCLQSLLAAFEMWSRLSDEEQGGGANNNNDGSYFVDTAQGEELQVGPDSPPSAEADAYERAREQAEKKSRTQKKLSASAEWKLNF